jgi:hypothetical protein
MAMINQILKGLSSLPPKMTTGVRELREMDKVSRQMQVDLGKEEAALLEKIKASTSLSSSDESNFKQQAEQLMARRQELGLLLDEQMKKAQTVYSHLDEKIKDFDAKTKRSLNSEDNEDQNRKKKKYPGDEELVFPPADPNEPVYCLCRRVSLGVMVGCDNDDCEIEWFHIRCVGLKDAPQDGERWFCPKCRGPEDNGNGEGAAT